MNFSSCIPLSLALCLACFATQVFGRILFAEFNMAGLLGNVTVVQETADKNTSIFVDLLSNHEPMNASWALHLYPVDYTSKAPCGNDVVGPSDVDLTGLFGPLQLPASNLAWEVADNRLSLWGSQTIWGKSVVVQLKDKIACAPLLTPDSSEHIMDARFSASVIGGIRFVQSNAFSETLLFTDLHWTNTKEHPPSAHEWRLLATDVLDTRGPDVRCAGALELFDPGHREDALCSQEKQEHCKAGDLNRKHGPVYVGGSRSRNRFVDLSLPLPSALGTSSSRSLVVSLMDASFPDAVVACALLASVSPRELVAILDRRGIRGEVRISQSSPYDVGWLRVAIVGEVDPTDSLQIQSWPTAERNSINDDPCNYTGPLFDPMKVGPVQNTSFSLDQFPAGALTAKHGLNWEIHARDPYVHAMGLHSVLGRSVAIVDLHGINVACGTFEATQPLTTAEAILVHPVAGRIRFQQVADDYHAETIMTVEGLVYTDGHGNATDGHKWYIHTNAVGRDFLNWTARCQSAGSVFDPFLVGKQQYCGHHQLMCPVGDLSRKTDLVSVAARRTEPKYTRSVFTILNVPLSGPASVIGRTLVLQDEHAPGFRGDRMSCTVIQVVHPIRALVNAWHSAERPVPVVGRIEFSQPLRGSATQTTIDLAGLEATASVYNIHQAPVPLELDFPCVQDSVQKLFDPFNISRLSSPTPEEGTSDVYAIGDLSGKYGSLRNKDELVEDFIDTNLPLQGAQSIVGRSVVIRKQDRNARWVCGTIHVEETEGATLIKALASFHHPLGFANGYVRLSQLLFPDGSTSDTWVEMHLRHAGKNNRNLTLNHDWAVYVNYVGQDATVQPQRDRCVAAGYKWNPFLIVDSIEDYKRECSVWTPFRCAMGDTSFRLDTIDVGGAAKSFSDPNLPLAGEYSVIGRSIVVFDKNRSDKRFACANIQRDLQVTTVVTVKNPHRFSSALFLETARDALGVPAWMMFADTEKTQLVLDNACVQVTVNFRGHDVQFIQRIFTDLLASGYVQRYTPSLSTDHPRFGYRLCRAEFNDASSVKKNWMVFGLAIITPLLKIYHEWQR